MVAEDVHWNFDGNLIISRKEWTNALTTVVNGSFQGLYIPDFFQLVDGNICATLYDLQGNQTGPFLGQPVTPGAHFKVRGAELGVFDSEVLLSELFTIQPLGKIKAQMAGQEEVPPPTPRGSQPVPNPQTSAEYRALLRQNMASMHKNVNAGNATSNGLLAAEDVTVDNNGDVTTGRDAFMDIMAARNQGLGAFPQKQFHDEYVLADGRLGAIEYIWHGRQKTEYMDRAADDTMVRVRGMLFFEFNKEGLVEKVVSVHDEAVIGYQLEETVRYLYP